MDSDRRQAQKRSGCLWQVLYGRQRSWIREGAEEEGGNEPDKDGFTKLTKAEQLELPFDLPDREKG